MSVLRTLHDNTVEPERIQRHEDASRPELPDTVADALEFDEEAMDTDEFEETMDQSVFADRATDEEAGAFDDLFDSVDEKVKICS